MNLREQLDAQRQLPKGMKRQYHGCAKNKSHAIWRSMINPKERWLLPSQNPWSPDKPKTACIHGHVFTPESTYFRYSATGHIWRQCRTCILSKAKS